MTGYPGVAATNAAGAQVMQAQRTLAGYLGGAHAVVTVTLAPGDQAQSYVEGWAADPKTGDGCAGWAGLLVTAPDDTRSTPLAWTTDTCAALEVHPVTKRRA